ncbi:hypothetical protein [Tahibacter aquaticus]|uniref:hypothetical protein n=1 Tax=Tahibacter aquaticus TaxID=520092 RepID=UPI00105E466B|nr:hypothetical protein [Tahibacter aquaticus]
MPTNDQVETASLACPNCGAAKASKIRQTIRSGKLFWSESTNCLICGTQIEVDGTGFPPENIRKILYVEYGKWKIRLTSKKISPVTLKIIRELFDLNMEKLRRIIENFPDIILPLTNVEATWLAQHLGRVGEKPTIELQSD